MGPWRCLQRPSVPTSSSPSACQADCRATWHHDELMSEGGLEEALALVAVCTVDLFLRLSAGVLRRRFFFASYCIGCTDKAPSVKIRCRKLTAWYVQRPE